MIRCKYECSAKDFEGCCEECPDKLNCPNTCALCPDNCDAAIFEEVKVKKNIKV